MKSTRELAQLDEGARVSVAGQRYRLQHPNANVYFIGIEDEFGDCEVIVWPTVFVRIENMLRHKLVIVTGTVSRREGTLSVILSGMRTINVDAVAINKMPAKEWR